MITFKHSGRFERVLRFFTGAPRINYQEILNRYGEKGVRALSGATPVDTGVTKRSWGYSTMVSRRKCSITWSNSNENQGIPIVILIQYGHGTRQGAYVQGVNFINPALQPIFDKIGDAVWREVKAL